MAMRKNRVMRSSVLRMPCWFISCTKTTNAWKGNGQLIQKFINSLLCCHSDLAAVLARVSVVVRRHPLAQQELGLLQEAWRVLELAGLENDEL